MRLRNNRLIRSLSGRGRNYLIDKNNSVCTCEAFRSRFADPYYDKSTPWRLYLNNAVHITTIFDYDICHAVLGCKIFIRLDQDCPKCLFVPMATLLCQCLRSFNEVPKISSDTRLTYLYRNEDEAVGIIINDVAIYLVSSKFKLPHLNGFEVISHSNN